MNQAKDMTISDWTDALASVRATPGGGGVGAVLAALAACMASMVANLTIGKKNYEDFSEESIEIVNKAVELKSRLLLLIDEDAAAFHHLLDAYKSGAKDEDYAAAAKPAAQMLYAITSIVDILGLLNEKGNRNLLSDVGVGASCAKSALETCRLNILVNIKYIKADSIRKSFTPLIEEIIPQGIVKAEFIYNSVIAKLE